MNNVHTWTLNNLFKKSIKNIFNYIIKNISFKIRNIDSGGNNIIILFPLSLFTLYFEILILILIRRFRVCVILRSTKISYLRRNFWGGWFEVHFGECFEEQLEECFEGTSKYEGFVFASYFEVQRFRVCVVTFVISGNWCILY